MAGEDELFFVLSNADRLTILSQIGQQPLRLSQIAKNLSTTVPETSRHLKRLSDAKIVDRNQDGAYVLTSLGKMILSLLPSFSVLQKQREYFLSHNLSFLPQGYTQRIGDLSGSEALTHLEDVLAFVEKVIEEAEEYLWFMADRPVFHHHRLTKNPERLSVRVLLSKDVERGVLQTVREVWERETKVEIRQHSSVNIGVVMNEKTAGASFPSRDGKLDLTTILTGNTPEFQAWCHDLFDHYWTT